MPHVALPEPVATDEALMLACRAGDAAAFATLARRYAARLVAYCMHFTRNAAAAEEAAQDTWLGLWSNRRAYAPASRFVVLLFTAARNRCRNVHRGNVRATAALGHAASTDVDALASALPSGLDDMLTRERRRVVATQMDGLSAPLREAVVLRVVDELPYADIGAIVGIPEATARSRVHLAIQQLRALNPKDVA